MKYTSLLVAATIAFTDIVSATVTNTVSLTQDLFINDGETAIVTQADPSTPVSCTIYIGNGATCILNNVNIKNSDESPITCEYNATIVLADYSYNVVEYSGTSRAAITAGPSDSLLTIDGNGALSCVTGAYGAGIGGGNGETVGNIRILNGNILARCVGNRNNPSSGAGIGSGNKGTCGDIEILGGAVTGACKRVGSNSSYCPGIGSGLYDNGGGVCGNIYIGPHVAEVVLERGTDAPFIGAGRSGTCGTITIDGLFNCDFIDSLTQRMRPQPIDSRAADGTARVFVINWDVDGSTAYTHMPAGDMPVYPHGTPTREASGGVKYKFAGWSPELSVVQGPATYTAVFAEASDACDGYGTAAEPYVVTSAADLAAILSFGYPEAMYVTLESGLAATGTFSVASSVTSLDIDLNGGEIVADGANSPAITLQSPAPVAISGTGAIKGAGTAEAVRTPELVTYGANVDVREADPVVAAAVFPNGGDSIISRFAQKGNGKWGVTAFAELQSGTAEGMDDGQVLIYAADTVGGLTNAAPLASGYEIKSRANAVKVDVEVESDAAAQFFRVKFENAD